MRSVCGGDAFRRHLRQTDIDRTERGDDTMEVSTAVAVSGFSGVCVLNSVIPPG